MASQKSTYVLGTGLSHDGSSCLLKDGKLVCAIEKERLTKSKHAGGNDNLTIQYCLNSAGIKLSDVDLIVQNGIYGNFADGNDWFQGERIIKDHPRIVTISHHLAHAYSVIGTAPFGEMAILIVDGCGCSIENCIDLEGARILADIPEGLRHVFFEKDSYYLYKNGRLKTIAKDFSPVGKLFERTIYHTWTLDSIGGVYDAASNYVFAGTNDAGKLMGLAPYGSEKKYTFPIFNLKDGRVFVDYAWTEAFRRPCHSFEDFKSRFQDCADLANVVQRETERAVLYLAQSRYEMEPHENLAYAGGVALNVVANRRLKTESKFKNLYVQPAAADNGLAIGCAYYGWLEILKGERLESDGNTCLGVSYPPQLVEAHAARFSEWISPVETKDVVATTAAFLADGKVVAWYQGGAEFGPRALGHRSILADPRLENIRDYINGRIKLREDFRPFAPAVLLEDMKTYFDCDYESPYMLSVAPVKDEWQAKVPSIVHKNKTGRLQTVTQKSDPLFYSLLKEFKKLTGVSILLNTSLNRRGMPIVETPADALKFFVTSELDVLVLHDKIYVKNPAMTAEVTILKITDLIDGRKEELARDVGHRIELSVPGKSDWILDLTGEDSDENPEATIRLSEATLQEIYLNPGRIQQLFTQKAIEVEGDVKALEWIEKVFSMRWTCVYK